MSASSPDSAVDNLLPLSSVSNGELRKRERPGSNRDALSRAVAAPDPSSPRALKSKVVEVLGWFENALKSRTFPTMSDVQALFPDATRLNAAWQIMFPKVQTMNPRGVMCCAARVLASDLVHEELNTNPKLFSFASGSLRIAKSIDVNDPDGLWEVAMRTEQQLLVLAYELWMAKSA